MAQISILAKWLFNAQLSWNVPLLIQNCNLIQFREAYYLSQQGADLQASGRSQEGRIILSSAKPAVRLWGLPVEAAPHRWKGSCGAQLEARRSLTLLELLHTPLSARDTTREGNKAFWLVVGVYAPPLVSTQRLLESFPLPQTYLGCLHVIGKRDTAEQGQLAAAPQRRFYLEMCPRLPISIMENSRGSDEVVAVSQREWIHTSVQEMHKHLNAMSLIQVMCLLLWLNARCAKVMARWFVGGELIA